MKNLIVALILVIQIFSSVNASGVELSNDQLKLDSSLIWRVTLPTTRDTSYMLGTIHLPLKAAFECIDTAKYLLQQSKQAYFEIVIDQQAMGEQAFFFLAKDKSETISALLDSSEEKLLYQKAEELMGPGAMVIGQLKPIGVYSVMTLSLLPADTTAAMDVLYQELAKEWGIPVTGLESIQSQFDVLDTIQKYGAKDLLLELIAEENEIQREANKLLQAYLNKDLNTIAELMNSEFSAALDEKIRLYLITERNQKMLTKMIQAARQNSCFFAVGAAHLVGEAGLIQGLRAAGFEVSPIKH